MEKFFKDLEKLQMMLDGIEESLERIETRLGVIIDMSVKED